ncbi:MAG TPA: hypothetical protein VGN19_01200 [Pedococcus sp.]|jgi:hypothetical protein|nr:hypothetical protein [Pedococcus sp.]
MSPDQADPSRDTELLDGEDLTILGEVLEMFDRLDPVPASLGDRVKFALTVQALEGEVAQLQRLSAEGAGVRSVDYARAQTVTFTSDSLTAMVTISALDAETVRVDGWVTGGRVEVELRERSRSSFLETDADGRFVFERIARGLAQFVLRPLDSGIQARPVITPTIEL